MLRNTFDWDCGKETNFWYIIKESYNAADYSKKTCKYINKANERFEYKIIDKTLFQNQGYRIYLQAFSKYRINDGFKQTKMQFVNRINQIKEDYDIWGAIDKETGNLEAYSICHRNDNVVEFESSKANPQFLKKHYVLYGLYDARNQYYLNEFKARYVITSARSISEHSNIQNFMIEKFGFRKAYCRLKLYYKPWLRFTIAVLYPFRRCISFRPVFNLLRFEEINREKA